MAAPTHAERVEWEFRQCRLAYRLLCFEARTQTICRFTSLSPHRLTKWRKRWGFDEAERSRGPTPNSFVPFFKFPALRVEGAYLGVLCDTFGILGMRDAADAFYCLRIGEQLCDLLEFHRASFPAPSMNFDQLLLLARGLLNGTSIQLAHCNHCESAVLRDPLQIARGDCDLCRRTKAPPLPLSQAALAGESVVRSI